MSKGLGVLLVEDSEEDALLVERELRDHGYHPRCTRVQDKAGFTRALEAQPWDVIIADYSLPRFSATAALTLLQKTGTDVPFIIVSGAIGQETAVAATKAGAHDCIIKGRLARLAPALERGLRDVAVRRERRRAEQSLRESEARYRGLVEASRDAIFITQKDRFVFANPAGLRLLGATRSEQVIGKSVFEFAHRDYHAIIRRRRRHMLELGRPAPAAEDQRAFGRFECTRPNEMWIGDTLHGPAVGGKKSYLFAFIDDHSRAVMGARWSHHDDVVRMAAGFRPALQARGVPRSCYLDNGSPFVDAWLLRACGVLGVKLIHSRPGKPLLTGQPQPPQITRHARELRLLALVRDRRRNVRRRE